jgi:ribonucleoside-diphosphate reductase alpha chain
MSKNKFLEALDVRHQSFALFDHPFTQQIWQDKYRFQNEASIEDTFRRVAQHIYQNDNEAHQFDAQQAMMAGLWMPGGRILAGSGTERSVTLMNCYVNHKLEDSMTSIMDGCKVAALTLQQGGGIGTDFSTLRPSGAVVKGVASAASGPLPFMDMFHEMADTIMSAGHRRGAMMGTISDTHPDLPHFILAKREANRLTNFNVSVLVSDAFMEAVKEDEDWMLHFPIPPLDQRDDDLRDLDFQDAEGIQQYVYSVHKARKLWELITENTYDWSEPGVIFIDRVNAMNNLAYCEEIRCTNPCGEQPLPPNGTCNLGAINLSRLVLHPFSDEAQINYPLLQDLTKLGVRFLDNVIDVTNYPLPEQKEEELNKRRIGLGVSGLADALAQLGHRYGSPGAIETTGKIFYTICQAAYNASVDLARERGTFLLYKEKQFLESGFAHKLDHAIIDRIRKYGIRNGVLLTVAPTGTTSIFYGDISSGIEPVFAHDMQRAVKQPDGSTKVYDTSSFSKRFYQHCMGNIPLSGHMVTTDDLAIEDHVTMQAAVQEWVDASVSKTVNCPKDTTFEAFQKVYDLAYSLGCKGCTTYRPSDVRGAVLVRKDKDKDKDKDSEKTGETLGNDRAHLPQLRTRPDELRGRTRRIRWPTLTSALYLIVNYTDDGLPYELFFASKDARLHDWMVATSLMITSLLRKGGDVRFIATELMAVTSLHDTAFIKGPRDEHPRSYGSLIALIGAHLAELLEPRNFNIPVPSNIDKALTTEEFIVTSNKPLCPQCGGKTIRQQEGCMICDNCGYSNCG